MLSTCPSQEKLEAFSIGALSSPQLESFALHFDRCNACRDKLAALDCHTDSFVAELAKLDRRQSNPDSSIPDEVLHRAREAFHCDAVTSSNLDLDPGRRYTRQLERGDCQLGRFELQSKLGDGSFGYVFLANDPKLDRSVAIKVQRSGVFADEDDIRRFLREAQSAAQLQHPGIVALYEIGRTEDDVCFLVNQYIDGETLESRLKDRRFGQQEAAQFVVKLADALHYAHQHNVVHRDIKPSNIILDQTGDPHITDFGLAKRLAADQSLTTDGRIMGTPAYMSPEQARGDSLHVDARSDVFSLGVMLYEMLTGERPFQGNRRLLMQQVIHEDPRFPRQLDDRIPKDLETICLRAMAKSATRRYQSAQELADDLRCQLAGEPIAARPLGYVESAWRWYRRNPVAASLLAAVTVGSAVGFWHLSNLSTYFVQQTALDSARSEALMLEGIRDHYSERLIDPAPAEVRGKLPLPAPYLIDVGDYISQGNSGMRVQLYGLHPWRRRTKRDAFQQTALTLLKERADLGETDLSYSEFTYESDQHWLRYAKGQIMKESCVKCHNESKDSPKRDWKVGDLVGALEVTRPLDREIERTRLGLRGAFVWVSATAFSLAGLSLGLILATRRRNRYKATK